MTTSRPGRTRWLTRANVVLALLLVVSFALRLACSTNVLWLDEIWSLQLASQISAPLAILTEIQHDNNHFLNTLVLYLLGAQRAWIVYRIPAVVAGTLAVLIAGIIGSRRGRVEQWITMALLAGSYLLVHYSSEARGYAFVVLFALSGYVCLARCLASDSGKWATAFSATCCLGLLSHPTFLHFYVAAFYWSACVWCLRRLPWAGIVGRLALCHAAPLVLGGILYLVNLRHIELGGGPEYQLADMLAKAGSLAVGGPLGGPLAIIASLVFAVGASRGLYLLWRDNAEQWRFFALAFFLPVILTVAMRPPFLFVRYFLVAIVFGLILCSFALANLYQAGRWGRAACATLLLVFFIGNAYHTAELIRVGRGQYLAGLEYMMRHDPSAAVMISSDHNWGNRILVEFYAQYLKPRRDVVYRDVGRWEGDHPGWLIIHRYRQWSDSPPQPDYQVEGASYVFQRTFECAPLSGWRWLCYRRQESE